MNKEICGFCPLQREKKKNTCRAPGAEPLRYAPEVTAPHQCRHYSCGEGLHAAQETLNVFSPSMQSESVTLFDGSRREGYPFGSADKPYLDTGRLVTDQGEIITHSVERNEYYLSPQKIPVKKP